MSKLNKILYTDINKLRLCNKVDAPVRFLLDKSPFDDQDDDEMNGAAKPKDGGYFIIGRILPKSAIYNERAYQIELKLPDTFPLDPPGIRFLTPIYHVNVDEKGNFCHELVKKGTSWKPTTSLVDVVKAVVDRIDSPDLDYATGLGIGTEYKEKRTEFDQKALEMVRKHGLPRE